MTQTVKWGIASFTESGDFSYANGVGYAYDRDYGTLVEVSSSSSGTLTFTFESPNSLVQQYLGHSNFIITQIRFIVWTSTPWTDTAYYDSGQGRWLGEYLQIQARRQDNTYYEMYAPWKSWDSSGTGWGASTFTDSAWASNTTAILLNMTGPGTWGINEVEIEVTWDVTHGYSLDLTPPGTTVGRWIIAPNMWDSTNGVFLPPTTTTAAVFEQSFHMVKPDPNDSGTWYTVNDGYKFLTEYH